MADPLGSTATLIKVLKDGQPVVDVSNKRVSALPEGTAKRDLPGPWQQTSVPEYLQERSFLGNLFETDDLVGIDTNVIDYTIEARWEYNGQYISDFHISGSGNVQIFSNLSIHVEVFDANYTSDDIAEMRYDIIVSMSNLTGGDRRVVIHALVRGDGSGMSLS
jgi:hypothetical protein